MLPFLSMTGSRSDGGRAVVMDGFAGRGRYSDGSPGSAELIMQAVEQLRKSRSVATFFAETDPANYRSLKAVVDEYTARGLPARAFHGAAEDHLASVVAAARGIPLFLFLDPCGAMLPFSLIKRVLSTERRQVQPPTELLLNFSADFTRRTAGQVTAGQTTAPGVARMDSTCGGTWWRDTALDEYRSSPTEDYERSAEAVVRGYARQLGSATRMLQVTVPVRKRLNLQPVYHLVFLTRSQYGIWVFADALGKARQEWLRTSGRLDDDSGPQLALPGMSRSDDMRQLIDDEKTRAQAIVEDNLRDLTRPGQAPIRLVDRARQVFGDAYSIATDETISAAVRALEARGDLTTVVPGKRIRDRKIGPA